MLLKVTFVEAAFDFDFNSVDFIVGATKDPVHNIRCAFDFSELAGQTFKFLKGRYQ